jgi:hypothetical protein
VTAHAGIRRRSHPNSDPVVCENSAGRATQPRDIRT